MIFVQQLEPADPDFYRIGYVQSVRAYGIEFKEGPDGFGVYASKDIEATRRARVSCSFIEVHWILTITVHVIGFIFVYIVILFYSKLQWL